MTENEKKAYEPPRITRVMLEDKEVVTMAAGCKTDTPGSGPRDFLPCIDGMGACFNLGS